MCAAPAEAVGERPFFVAVPQSPPILPRRSRPSPLDGRRVCALGACDRLVGTDREPTTHLDPPHQAALARLLRRRTAAGTTVVSVLHDLSLALVADRLLLMDKGRVRAEGATDDAALHAALVDTFEGAIRIERAGERWIAFPHLDL